MRMAAWRRHATRAVAPLALVALCAGPARAADLTLLVARAWPGDTWSTGFGAALGTRWFHVLMLEGEAARHSGDDVKPSMTSFTGTAALAPSFGHLVPYAGVGIGVYRQSRAAISQTDVLHSFAVGVKLELGLVVLRAEYRSLHLPQDALFPMDKRVSLGAGISF
jgi:Outer membrane protein beta-barrel domain